MVRARIENWLLLHCNSFFSFSLLVVNFDFFETPPTSIPPAAADLQQDLQQDTSSTQQDLLVQLGQQIYEQEG